MRVHGGKRLHSIILFFLLHRQRGQRLIKKLKYQTAINASRHAARSSNKRRPLIVSSGSLITDKSWGHLVVSASGRPPGPFRPNCVGGTDVAIIFFFSQAFAHLLGPISTVSFWIEHCRMFISFNDSSTQITQSEWVKRGLFPRFVLSSARYYHIGFKSWFLEC